jgi:hypothetical protein
VARYADGTLNCSVEGCERPALTRGWCQAHYFRVRRNGHPGAAAIDDRRRLPCSVEGCERPSYARGMCQLHDRRVAKGGHPSYMPPPRRGPANPEWKGDQVGYTAAHDRVRRARGPASAQTCACGAAARHWAYTHDDPAELVAPDGVRYSGDPARYVALCVPCHKSGDLARLRRG